MTDRNLSLPISSPKPKTAGLLASLSNNLTQVSPKDEHTSQRAAATANEVNPPTSPTLQQPSPTPSIRSSRSKKKPPSIEVVVPMVPKELNLKSDWPIVNLAQRLDRLQEYIRPKNPVTDDLTYWNETPMPTMALRKLLCDSADLRMSDLEALVLELSDHYKQIDKSWITRVCYMLAQAKTSQLQIVSIARTLQNYLNGPTASIAYLENMSKCPWAEKNSEFELRLRLIDIDEKTATILEHERLILHVAKLAEKLHSMAPPDAMVTSLLRTKMNEKDSDGTLSVYMKRIAQLEARAEAIVAATVLLETNILKLTQTIREANSLHASVQRLEYIKASQARPS